MTNEFLTTILTQFELLPDWAQSGAILVTGLVTAFTAFTAATPTKVDDTYLPFITKPLNLFLAVANFIAGNFGYNKNKDS